MQKWRRRIFELCLFCLLAGAAKTAVVASEPFVFQSGRKWNGRSVRLSLSESLLRQSPSIKFGSDVEVAVRFAAGEWQRVADIKLAFAVSPLESVSSARSGGDGTSLVTVAATSENLALFPEGERSAPAYTRLFFDRRGAIVEADVVLNPHIQFSTDGTTGTFDLQSVLTHEFGHVLGLGHSPTGAASMYGRLSPIREETGRGFEARTLSMSDVSAARSVYGPSDGVVNCCASVAGTLGADLGASGVVWAEEVATGRMVAADESDGGPFSLSGLMPGRYRLLAQGKRLRGGVKIAELDLDLPTTLRRVPAMPAVSVDLSMIGTNGELGTLPVTLYKGNSQQILLGGTGLDPTKVKFGVSSPYLSIDADSVFPMNYAGGISVVAVTVTIEPDTPEGDYSVFVETSDGERRYLLGIVSVE